MPDPYRDIKKITAPLQRRVMNTVGRAVIKRTEDGARCQETQIGLTRSELRDGVERFQNYGFSSVPHAGAEACVVFLGGNRDHGIVVATEDRRYRITSSQPGEVSVYSDEGDYITLKRGRIMEINTQTLLIKAEEKVRIESPLVETTGALIDSVEAGNSDDVQTMRDKYNEHGHAGTPPPSPQMWG